LFAVRLYPNVYISPFVETLFFFSYHVRYMRMGPSFQEPWREDIRMTSRYSMYSGHWHYMTLMISFMWEAARHSLPVVSSSKDRLYSELV